MQLSSQTNKIVHYLINDLFCFLNENIERIGVETVDLNFQQMAREFTFACLNKGCFGVAIEGAC